MSLVEKLQTGDCCFNIKTKRRENDERLYPFLCQNQSLQKLPLKFCHGLKKSRPISVIYVAGHRGLGFFVGIVSGGRSQELQKLSFSQKQMLFIPIQYGIFSTSRPLLTTEFHLSSVDNNFLVVLSVKACSLSKTSRSISCFQNETFEKFKFFVKILQNISQSRKGASSKVKKNFNFKYARKILDFFCFVQVLLQEK